MDTSIHFKFDEAKATQVAARLTEKSGNKVNYLLLTKMMYAIDRTALANWGQPVSGGAYCSLPKGPAISEAYDLIKKGKHPEKPTYWTKHLATKGYNLVLKKKPGNDELSPAEIELIDTIHAMLAHQDKWDVVEWTHNEFKEWEDPKGSSNTIPVEKILQILGKSESEIKAIAKETAYHNQISTLFAR